jgi:hypothetical protein
MTLESRRPTNDPRVRFSTDRVQVRLSGSHVRPIAHELMHDQRDGIALLGVVRACSLLKHPIHTVFLLQCE